MRSKKVSRAGNRTRGYRVRADNVTNYTTRDINTPSSTPLSQVQNVSLARGAQRFSRCQPLRFGSVSRRQHGGEVYERPGYSAPGELGKRKYG